MRRIAIFTGLALALAACGRQEPAADGNVVDELGGNVAMPAPAPTLPEPSVNAAAEADTETTVPAAFRGRWGMVANDCDPARADAKGLMTVEARRLTFYESRADVMRLEKGGDDRLELALAFTGEGQEWMVASTFALEDGGSTLIRTDRGDQPGRFVYEKCPA